MQYNIKNAILQGSSSSLLCPPRPRAFFCCVLGDELSSTLYPNDQLLKKALNEIQDGDITMAHLGIWSRKDPWAPGVLDALISGLKAKGFCFATIQEKS